MDSSTRIKRLVIPIVLGIFVVISALFGVIYMQQKSQQTSLREQIGWMNNMMSQPVNVNEEYQARFEEIQQYVPVIATAPQAGELTELEFIEEVHAKIIDKVSDPLLYPEIDAGTAGNFGIRHVGSTTKKINNINYKVFTFNIEIGRVAYDELRAFILDISTAESLRTLVISGLKCSTYGTDASVDLDFDIYCRVK